MLIDEIMATEASSLYAMISHSLD